MDTTRAPRRTASHARGGLATALGTALATTLATALAACSHPAPPPAAPPAPIPTAAAVEPEPPPPPPITYAGQRAQLRAAIDSLIGQPRFHNAFWGALIIDPARGDTLYARNADKLFMPASNVKIITAAVALTQLGPDFQFRTAFAVRGRVRRGVIDGDLVVLGRGDPTVSDHMMHDAMVPLRSVAESLAAHGIRRVTGHLVAGGDAFPDVNIGYGWDWDDLSEPYGAGVDELMFNEGFTTVTLRGAARPGTAAHVATTPLADYPPVRSRVTTAKPGGGSAGATPSATYDAARGELVLDGSLGPGDTATLLIAYRNPAAAYLHGLAAALRARGIALRRVPVILPDESETFPAIGVPPADRHAPPMARLDTLFTLASPPLRDVMPALLKPSQNQIAEILLKTLGLEKTGVGSADSGRRVVESQLTAWGVPSDAYVIHDGSGLSRHDYLSPGALVRVLATIEHDTAYQVFYEALPIAGLDGTIADRMRGTPASGNVHAKTGYVDRARSLSGYVTTTDGVGLVFSFLCNNWTVPVHDVEQAQDDIAVRLASMTLGAR